MATWLGEGRGVMEEGAGWTGGWAENYLFWEMDLSTGMMINYGLGRLGN